MESEKINNHAAFIWSVADLLRGVYKQSEYGRVILPLTVLRRLDCVLEPTKEEVLAAVGRLPDTLQNRDPLLAKFAGQSFFNTSRHTFATLLGDPDNVAGNLRNYIAGFSESARDIVDKFNFDGQIDRLNDHNLLYLVVSKFADLDLSPETVSDLDMGYLYEELIRRFSELSNETAGEHFTPREVIRLMVNLLFREDDELLTKPGVVKTLFDPACGTGGMLSVAEDYLRQLNPEARLMVFGQEVNAETYATCRADMLIKGQEASNIKFGNSFDDDQHQGERFDYLLANPPFGVEWKMVADTVKDEHAVQGFAGRFGAGLPRINDGSFLFLQHMISKMKRLGEGGARLAIVFNGSPLFTGGAGSGESEIRRWIIESDMLEAVVALPDQLFYNTGISTYIWVVTNRKAPQRRGEVQLIDARDQFTKMSKNLGQKRKELSADQIDEIARLYGSFEEGPQVKIFSNESFGFIRITVERPLRLRWEITDDTLSAVVSDKKIAKLDHDQREALLSHLRIHHGEVCATENEAEQVAQDALSKATADKPATLVKAVTDALAIRDPNAPVIADRASTPKPDPDLRDYENVPLPPKAVAFEPDPAARLGAERIGGLCGVVSVPPVDEFGGDQYGDREAQGGVAAVCSAVGVAAELPVVGQPGVGGLDDPALAQRFGSGPAPGLAGRAFGCAHDVVDAPASAGVGHGVAGVAAVEVDGLYVQDQAGGGNGGQGGVQHGLVVDVGRVGGPADGDAVAVCGDGPLPPELAPVNRAFAGSLAAAGRLVDGPVNADIGHIEADYAVERRQRLRAQLVEHPGLDPLVAAAAKRGIRHPPFQDGLNVGPRRARHQPDQQPPKAKPVRNPRPVTAQGVRPVPARQQGPHRLPHSIHDLPVKRAHNDRYLHRVVGLVLPDIKAGTTQRPVDTHLSARPLRNNRVPLSHRRLPRNRSPPLHPRRLARLRQNQNWLRNPPNPSLLFLHPTPRSC